MNINIYDESIKNFKNDIFKEKNILLSFFAHDQRWHLYNLYRHYCLMFKYGENLRIFAGYHYFRYVQESVKTNIQIRTNEFIQNLTFHHYNVLVHKNTKIGKNVMLVGNNCITDNNDGAPNIGDNVFIGYGAMIIGKVRIADNVIIGGGSYCDERYSARRGYSSWN